MTGRLFESFSFGAALLRNRIVMAPMTRRRAPGGVPTSDMANYYARRAASDVGLIITEGVSIEHEGAAGYENVPVFFGLEATRGWESIVRDVHREGGHIAVQLWHVGSVRRASETVGPAPGYGPCEIVENGKRVAVGMDLPEIINVQRAYAQAARLAHELGFDGIELHGAHGYLLDQFMRAETNQRTDSYGGEMVMRMRFGVETVQQIRAVVPRQFPLIFRFSQWKADNYDAKMVESPHELGEFTRHLVDAGVDFLHPSTRRFWAPAFEGSDKSLAHWTREVSGVPVIGVGSVGLDKAHGLTGGKGRDLTQVDANVVDLSLLMQQMELGAFDLVAVGRALLADPEWVPKVKSGLYGSITPLTRRAYEELVV
ncbi:MAG: N-ethylmaleimide reductase [Nitrospira sp.]|nr:N-ethylmaleimide reductase [Nitrospira sp.]